MTQMVVSRVFEEKSSLVHGENGSYMADIYALVDAFNAGGVRASVGVRDKDEINFEEFVWFSNPLPSRDTVVEIIESSLSLLNDSFTLEMTETLKTKRLTPAG